MVFGFVAGIRVLLSRNTRVPATHAMNAGSAVADGIG
jgi:hypothetical protein